MPTGDLIGNSSQVTHLFNFRCFLYMWRMEDAPKVSFIGRPKALALFSTSVAFSSSSRCPNTYFNAILGRFGSVKIDRDRCNSAQRSWYPANVVDLETQQNIATFKHTLEFCLSPPAYIKLISVKGWLQICRSTLLCILETG